MMRFLLLLFICSCGLVQAQEMEIIDKGVALVGNEIVLLSEVEEQYSLLSERQPDITEDQKCVILENIMVQKLLVNQAQLDSVTVGEEEVEAQLDARIDRILAMMNNDVAQFEEFYGRSITEVKSQFREDLRNQILAERMQARATESMETTPAQVRTFFQSVPVDSLPYFNAEVEIAEIVARPKVSLEEYDKAVEKLEKLKSRIQEGEDFATLAQTFSDDPGSAANGGELGWMKRGSLVPEYEAEAYNLETNEISDIVESEFGLHLIQLLGRRGNMINTRHILIKPEITNEDKEKTVVFLDSVRQLILENSLSFSQAVKKFSDEKAFSFTNGGRLTNPKTGNTFFEVGDLDTDIYFTIDTLGVGDISRPIAFTSYDGEEQFRIIQLSSYSDPHQASLQKDYYKIQKAATEHRKSQRFYNWLEEKVHETYVKVEAPFDLCPNMVQWVEKGDGKM